jgi:hypothetical protein
MLNAAFDPDGTNRLHSMKTEGIAGERGAEESRHMAEGAADRARVRASKREPSMGSTPARDGIGTTHSRGAHTASPLYAGPGALPSGHPAPARGRNRFHARKRLPVGAREVAAPRQGSARWLASLRMDPERLRPPITSASYSDGR